LIKGVNAEARRNTKKHRLDGVGGADTTPTQVGWRSPTARFAIQRTVIGSLPAPTLLNNNTIGAQTMQSTPNTRKLWT